jgi:hypothetical protein
VEKNRRKSAKDRKGEGNEFEHDTSKAKKNRSQLGTGRWGETTQGKSGGGREMGRGKDSQTLSYRKKITAVPCPNTT